MKSFDGILRRGHSLDLDKAWEASKTRRAIIAGVMYIVTAAFLKSIGLEAFLLTALVPASGYLFSILALSVVKDIWIKKYDK